MWQDASRTPSAACSITACGRRLEGSDSDGPAAVHLWLVKTRRPRAVPSDRCTWGDGCRVGQWQNAASGPTPGADRLRGRRADDGPTLARAAAGEAHGFRCSTCCELLAYDVRPPAGVAGRRTAA